MEITFTFNSDELLSRIKELQDEANLFRTMYDVFIDDLEEIVDRGTKVSTK
jgi:hypothetical protein